MLLLLVSEGENSTRQRWDASLRKGLEWRERQVRRSSIPVCHEITQVEGDLNHEMMSELGDHKMIEEG